jgi:hypothetical protein
MFAWEQNEQLIFLGGVTLKKKKRTNHIFAITSNCAAKAVWLLERSELVLWVVLLGSSLSVLTHLQFLVVK